MKIGLYNRNKINRKKANPCYDRWNGVCVCVCVWKSYILVVFAHRYARCSAVYIIQVPDELAERCTIIVVGLICQQYVQIQYAFFRVVTSSSVVVDVQQQIWNL